MLMGLKVIFTMFPLPLNGNAGAIDVAVSMYSSPFWVKLFSAMNIGGEFEESCRTPFACDSTPS